MKQQIQLNVNGKPVSATVESRTTLLEVLIDELKLSRTKEGCSVGECGACAVLIDGKPVHSCLVLAIEANDKSIVTSEALEKESGGLPVQEQLIDRAAIQRNIYTPGAGVRQEFLSFCHICAGHCSVKVIVQDGKVIDMAPDEKSGLPNELCPIKKGRLSIPEILTHPDRLKYPQKRVGARGEDKWQRISWDEALDTIAGKLSALKSKYGPESVAMCLGEPKGLEFAFGQRFASAFGTPNVVTPGFFCGTPTVLASNFTFGTGCVPDEECRPALIVFWGVNPVHTSCSMRRETISSYLESGTKMLVIDPRRIDVAALSDLWLRVRPGGDGALALGLLKVIVEEKLYDKEFVDNWTAGFEQLEEHLNSFSLDDVSRVTWVPGEQIKQAARLYAGSKPATMQLGNALDQVANAFQTLRAISILRAITGNLNVPGGDVFLTPPPYTRPGRFFLLSKFPRDAKKAVGGEFGLGIKSAFVPAHSLIKAIVEEKPYPVRAALFMLTDPLVSYPDSNETYKALMKLEFSVVLEIFMSPTAALADIVLPVATGMEHDEIGYWPGWYEEVRAHPKVVDPPGEAWPDTRIINELAKRLGLKEYFWEDDSEALDFWLQPSGLHFEDLKQRKTMLPKREYKPHDFKTPSGKVEIYCKNLEQLGYSPLPLWQELSQLPDVPKDYPLIMTNAKEEAYMLTGYKMIASLRNMKPEPMASLNPETAEKAGLKEGDMVYIETKKGRIIQRLYLDPDLDPRVVLVAFGWWFPEEGSKNLYGWQKSNLNVLTDDEPPYEVSIGTKQLRGIHCRVYKA